MLKISDLPIGSLVNMFVVTTKYVTAMLVTGLFLNLRSGLQPRNPPLDPPLESLCLLRCYYFSSMLH